VNLHILTLKEALKVNKVHCVIGGSLGGMQALEWGFLGGNFVKSIAPIACGGRHHAWQIGISELQRRAIYADPNFQGGNYSPSSPPSKGFSLARQIAMVSYRTHESFEKKFGRNLQVLEDHDAFNSSKFAVEGYLRYQGEKFLTRFDPNSYIAVTKMMDSHDVARGRGDYKEVLQSLKIPSLVIGVDSDVLYPLSEQEELAKHLPKCQFVKVKSLEGHDGFLLEQEQIGDALIRFLAGIPN